MKKLACLGVLLCLALAVFVAVPTTVTAAAEDNDSVVIYVYDEQEWSLSIYCYNGSGDFGPSWPGTELDSAPEIGEDWYSYTFPVDPTSASGVHLIIFDSANDQVNRVDVLYNKNNAYYHTYAAKGFKTKDDALTDAVSKRPKLVDTLYVYNYDSQNYETGEDEERWSSITATCYDNKTGEQFGDEVTLVAAPSIGAHWYKYDLPEAAKTAAAADYKFRARVVLSGDRERLVIVSPVKATQYYNTYREYGFSSTATAASEEFNCMYSIPETGTTILYYYNTQRWKTVYAYAYWTYTTANNTNVEDFGSYPGKELKKVEGRENWYYIELKQDVTKLPGSATGVGIVFNGNTKGKAGDAFIDNHTNVYVNEKGEKYNSFEACEQKSTMIDPLPEIDDFVMDFDKIDTSETTYTVKDYKNTSLTAPIIVMSVAGAVCVAVGTVLIIFTVRRKKK